MAPLPQRRKGGINADTYIVVDGVHEGGLPLEDEVDDEAEEDPVEAARQHLGRVQRADAEVEGAICVEVGLVHILKEEALLVGGERRRAKQTPLVVLDDDALVGHSHSVRVAAAPAHDHVHQTRQHLL